MTKKTFHQIAKEMFACIKVLHSHRLVHRDIKPENFRGKDDKIYIIDFGTFIKLEALMNNKLRSFIGTAKFASIDVLR